MNMNIAKRVWIIYMGLYATIKRFGNNIEVTFENYFQELGSFYIKCASRLFKLTGKIFR